MVTEEQQRSVETVDPEATPLPATLTFVMLIGVTFLVLWFGVFAILKLRW